MLLDNCALATDRKIYKGMKEEMILLASHTISSRQLILATSFLEKNEFNTRYIVYL